MPPDVTAVGPTTGSAPPAPSGAAPSGSATRSVPSWLLLAVVCVLTYLQANYLAWMIPS